MARRSGGLKPALSYDFLTPFYDPLVGAVLRESRIKAKLVERARPARGKRILDLGCGTSTLTLMLKRARPASRVVGLDGDPTILRLASQKIREAGLAVPLVCALADRLPFPDGCFDRVVSSLMIHHLDRPTKRKAFQEIHRVLRPGGEFHLADFGPPRSLWSRAGFLLIQFLDGFETTGDNSEGRIPSLVEEAGLVPSLPPVHFNTLVGSIALWSFGKPASSPGS